MIKARISYIFINFGRIFFEDISLVFIIGFTMYLAQNIVAAGNDASAGLEPFSIIELKFLLLISFESSDFLSLLLSAGKL